MSLQDTVTALRGILVRNLRESVTGMKTHKGGLSVARTVVGRSEINSDGRAEIVEAFWRGVLL